MFLFFQGLDDADPLTPPLGEATDSLAALQLQPADLAMVESSPIDMPDLMDALDQQPSSQFLAALELQPAQPDPELLAAALETLPELGEVNITAEAACSKATNELESILNSVDLESLFLEPTNSNDVPMVSASD